MKQGMATEGPATEVSSESVRSVFLPSLSNLQAHPLTPHSAALMPIFSACYVSGRSSVSAITGGGLAASVVVSPLMRSRAWFSSSTQPPEIKGFKEYKLPPVNPPDRENPDAVTLRAQWNNAVRLYGRMYSHAWGTAILAGFTLFGIGWYIKGESPLKALDPTGEIKKKEIAD